MHDPYIIIRRRIGTALLWAAAIAIGAMIVDALLAIARYPYVSANASIVVAVAVFATLLFARFMLGVQLAKRRRASWLLSLAGGLLFYALIYRMIGFSLAQPVLVLWALLAIFDLVPARRATTRQQVWFLVLSRVGALFGFLLWQSLSTTIVISPGATILVNLILVITVIRHLGRIEKSVFCMLACSAAFALTATFTFSVPFLNAWVANMVTQLLFTCIVFTAGAIVGALLGSASHAAAEPQRRAEQEPQLDQELRLESGLLQARLRSAGAIRQQSIADNHAREEIDAAKAAPVLEKALDDSRPELRGAAASLLGRLEPKIPASADKLLQLAGDPNQPDVEGQVRDALCRVAPHAVEQLARATSSDNSAIREAAVYALRDAGAAGDQAIGPLRKALTDEVSAIRQKAAGSLARLGATDSQTMEALAQLQSDSSLTVRLAAEKALRELQVAATRAGNNDT